MIPGSANALLAYKAGSSQYQISRSLRFNSADSASLSRTVSSASNRTTWTFSCWVKRSVFGGSGQTLFTGGTNSSNSTRLAFDTSNRLVFENEVAATTTVFRGTTAVYRDPSAWMHVVLAVDTTLATAADRVKLWVNGAEVTVFANNNAPTQNLQLQVNAASVHYIGQSFTPAYANFYLADVYFVDGLALTASNFGETDATTGVWNPKTATGITSYGTNGFRLTFSDNSAATATTLGKDAAGSNNWTPNNFIVTAGSGNDSLVDSPTNYGTDTGAGGEVRGNYCTLNPLNTSVTFTNGALEWNGTVFTGRSWRFVGTLPVSSGKWYFEYNPATAASERHQVGIISASQAHLVAPELTSNNGIGDMSTAYVYQGDSGNKRNNASGSTYGAAWSSTSDIIGVAFDADAGTLVFYKNGVSQGTAFTGIPAGSYIPACSLSDTDANTNNMGMVLNFGQRPFAYTAPSGYKALCTQNLPTPTILSGATAMDVKLYTGNGSTQTISGLGFSPDLAWIKGRSGSLSNSAIYDTVRGVQLELSSAATDAETNQTAGLTAFNSDGFTTGSRSNLNANTVTFVAWCWDAGNSTVTNTSGTISSQVRANASAGFSVVTYTGTSVNGTVGHGLGVAPQMIIVKRRNASINWVIGHTSIGFGSYLFFTTATTSSSNGVWNSTAPTSTVFSVGTAGETNNNAATYVAYCFAPVSGYSSFGSYTSTGANDGPFIYTGFAPKFILVKSTTSSTSWVMKDSQRPGYNVAAQYLAAEASSIESTVNNTDVDFLSNGFKWRAGGAASITNNSTVATYIYAAFAENPFSISRAR